MRVSVHPLTGRNCQQTLLRELFCRGNTVVQLKRRDSLGKARATAAFPI